MKTPKQLKDLTRPCLAVGLAAAMVCGMARGLNAQDAKPDSPPQKPATPAGQPASGSDAKQQEGKLKNGKIPGTTPRKLSGAELYSMHCNRCHPERYPTERTAAQWKTILLHMRVRANLPAEQAREILKYLQDNSGR